MSNYALITLPDALRGRRAKIGTRWRRLSAGDQTMLAHLRKGDTYAELATGYGIGTTTGAEKPSGVTTGSTRTSPGSRR